MPLFDECCVLIPASTLEDFPSDLSDSDARSLLAAWTILWHPSLLAECGQLPVWCRADSPPETLENRLLAVPTPSQSRLPDGYRDAGGELPKLPLDQWRVADRRCWPSFPWRSFPLSLPSLSVCGSRSIGIEDFFATGYAVLQIQVMTRRLRYTSNLDEVHLQNCVVAAAQAFVAGDADKPATRSTMSSIAWPKNATTTSRPILT